jgi:aminoglycoside 2'-N-acetyltransferase I
MTARIRREATSGLSTADLAQIRSLLEAAFGDDEDERLTEEDWQHALGGLHVVLEIDGEIVAHAAVVERQLHVGGRPLRTGYVEAVATVTDRQGQGHGTTVMAAVGEHIAAEYELGALGTGEHRFYERLGWRTWQGPSFVRTPDGDRPTPDEDGFIMILRTPRTPELDPRSPIGCDWRPGDAW